MPFFSIVIPAYNRAGILPRCLDSILNQHYADFEVVVVDDGSADSTRAVVAEYLKDARFRYVFQNNQGVSAARNHGAAISTGKYLTFLDSDDVAEPDWLLQFKQLIDTSQSDLVSCRVKMKSVNGDIKIVPQRVYDEKIRNWNFLAGAWAIRRDEFVRIGMYDEKLRFGENAELRLRVDIFGLSVSFNEAANVIYHQTGEGGSGNLQNKLASNLYFLQKHRSYFLGHPSLYKVYLQNTAVLMVRNNRAGEARSYFAKAWQCQPLDLKAAARFFISCLPVLAKKTWE